MRRRRGERGEERSAGGSTRYQMREKMVSIEDDYWNYGLCFIILRPPFWLRRS
ncbi:hypothetical protein ACFLY4_04865 [Chloroflexota bacterium]